MASSSSSSYASVAAGGGARASTITTIPPTPPPPANPNPNPNPHPTTDLVSSDSDLSYSSGDDAAGTTGGNSLESSILAAYLEASESRSGSVDLAKIRSFLSSASRRRSPSCLICLDPIRFSDPTWSCSASCFALFHLPCLQSWARQSVSSPSSPNWHCPKCRFPYPKTLTPKSYLCFCGKVEDPTPDPWVLPHSCGEVCGRSLGSGPDAGCGHSCLLLCHPGPCPPCPAVVPAARCFCGARPEARRCARQRFSCGNQCRRQLPCGRHRCPITCHDGPCPPCAVRGRHRCECGKVEEERLCAERGFRCENHCNRMLECGKHKCERGCHGGLCGDCPLRGRRTCPCGKREYPGLDCDAEAPTCGYTCEKMLGCGRHRCPERCHRGPCVETCRLVVTKSCRCGGLRKQVPCYQELTCERKCQRLRDCGRHACKHRCCGGDCAPCPEICDRRLRCNNHKCPSPCHRGACSPCPLMVTISCFCGETCFEVPCGAEKNQKPPKCSKKCHISRLCRHKFECRTHKCHYGACPPCRLICGEEFFCGHTCKERCHGPIPPPNPEFTLKPKKKKREQQTECTPGSPCPPCQEVVLISCFGRHLGEERPMICSKRRQFPCQNLCGNLLRCGNHYCTKSCHVLKTPLLSLDQPEGDSHKMVLTTLSSDAQNALAEPCEECNLPCQKVREPSCSHPCPLPCHLNDCPPCKALVKRSCHCGAMVHVFECMYFNNLNDMEQQNVRSCGGPCHRKLPNCPHLCSETCHPGQCPSVNECMKKVTVRCACNTIKKEQLCQDVLKAYRKIGRDPKDISKSQFGVGLLPCGLDCRKKVEVAESELHLRKSHDIKSPTVEIANVPRRRKRRERGQQITQVSKLQSATSRSPLSLSLSTSPPPPPPPPEKVAASMDGGGGSVPRSVEDIFKDFRSRRSAILRALTHDVEDFYAQCDPDKENLCLYGYPTEAWEVALPAEEVPTELPEPALGINFARDGMNRRDWLALVAVHSDSWLLSVAFYYGARLNRNERKRLFGLINDLPTVYEAVSSARHARERSGIDSGSNKSKLSTKQSSDGHIENNSRVIDEGYGEDDGEHSETLCGTCGGIYSADEFWIGCDVCERWYHGKCVKITPAKAESIKQYKCPGCSSKKARQQ